MAPIRIGLVGLGKIARDQHLPAISQNPAFVLSAIASHHGRLDQVPTYSTLAEMMRGEPDLAAVALCTPPQARYELARAALNQGRHVLLEKPPGATVTEVQELMDLAAARGVALLATWHSRCAPAVGPAQAWLAGRAIRRVRIDWKEDVRQWHPGQEWIWQPGGMGVFDPGINALSIITRILQRRLIVKEAVLEFPANRQAPIAARLDMRDPGGIPVTAEFDWRWTGRQCWDISVETDDGMLVIDHGGAGLTIEGVPVALAPEGEYVGLYAQFARLVAARQVDVDLSPLLIVADAFLRGRRDMVDPFVE